MRLDMKRDGKCRSKAFDGRWFLLFQNDALPGSQGNFWYNNKAKQLGGMVQLPVKKSDFRPQAQNSPRVAQSVQLKKKKN